MNSAPCNLMEQVITTGTISVVLMTLCLYFIMKVRK